jgi:hypothetical protein
MPRRGSPADARNRTDTRHEAGTIVVAPGVARTERTPSTHRPAESDARQCEVCGTMTTQRCMRCRVAHYCSATCQEVSWGRGHQAACDAMCDPVHHALIMEVKRVSLAHDTARCMHFIMLDKQPSTREGVDTHAALLDAIRFNSILSPFTIVLVSVAEKREGKQATVMFSRAGGTGPNGQLHYVQLYTRLMTMAQLRQLELRKASVAEEGAVFCSGRCALAVGAVCTDAEGAHWLRFDKYEYQVGLRGGAREGGGKVVDYRMFSAPVEHEPYALFPLVTNEREGLATRLYRVAELRTAPPPPTGVPPQQFGPDMLLRLISGMNDDSEVAETHQDAETAAIVADNKQAAVERGMHDCADAREARARGKALAADHERVSSKLAAARAPAPTRTAAREPVVLRGGVGSVGGKPPLTINDALDVAREASARNIRINNDNGLANIVQSIGKGELNVMPRRDLGSVFEE